MKTRAAVVYEQPSKRIEIEELDLDGPREDEVLIRYTHAGWGSAVYTAKVAPGDTVAIYGVGGIGINAVQGARYAGARNVIAIDPLENKREKAMEFGATHAFGTAEEAQQAITELTRARARTRRSSPSA